MKVEPVLNAAEIKLLNKRRKLARIIAYIHAAIAYKEDANVVTGAVRKRAERELYKAYDAGDPP